MTALIELLNNIYFTTALLAWFIAQLIKFVISLIVKGQFDLKQFVSSGGMPSSHSAFVMGVTGALGVNLGWDDPITGLSLIFSLVVMYDATGVRRAAGKQAEILNKLIFDTHSDKKVTEKRLKELIGHTPFQVFAGAFLGLVIAFIMG